MSDSNEPRNDSAKMQSRRTLLFALSQLAIWPVGIFAAAQSRVNYNSQKRQLPAMRNNPRLVRPKFNQSAVVSDEQLLAVLKRLRLAKTSSAKVNHVDHAVRLWGPQATFDREFFGSEEMISLLVNDQALRENWGEDVRPLLEKTPDGLRVRTQEGAATSSHVDHTLATLTELGLPLSYAVQGRSASGTLADMLTRALRSFSLNQKEYEWTAMTWALYARTARPWVSREGQFITFDSLARRIMREPLGHGVCYGGHRLFTLAILSRIDLEDLRLFSSEVREEVESHFRRATRQLVATQDAEGYWDQRWPGYSIPSSKPLWTQGARLVATGHALEWWAMLPTKELLPPRETLVRASQWLVREVEAMEDETVAKNYTFLTHAGRALSLWRGELPFDSWKRLTKEGTRQAVARRLWREEHGVALSIELIMLATITVIGLLAGLSAYRDAAVQELGDAAAGVASLNQTFDYEGVRQSGSFGTGVSEIRYEANVQGSQFVDNADFCEAVLDATGVAPVCVTFDASTVEDEQ